MKQENNDVLNMLSLVVAITTLILLVLATLLNAYAYKISSNEKEIITDKNIIVNFETTKEFGFTNAKPDTTLTYRFTISSKEDATGISDYGLMLNVSENDINAQYLGYQLTSKSSLGQEGGSLITHEYTDFNSYVPDMLYGTIKPGEVQTYELMIYYSVNSSSKKNKLAGSIIVLPIKK